MRISFTAFIPLRGTKDCIQDDNLAVLRIIGAGSSWYPKARVIRAIFLRAAREEKIVEGPGFPPTPVTHRSANKRVLRSHLLSPKRHVCIYPGMANLTEFSLADATAVLTRTPATLNAMLRGLPSIWVRGNEGKDTWSPYDIVGHLIIADRTDWMPRVRIILESGEARPFDPFDRFAQMRMKESQDKPPEIGHLLDDFARLRKESLAALEALNLKPEDLARRGTHPALGVVTLSELLATWVVHDLTHLHQLSRVMAHQYRDAVGPWSVYLGVLKCAGHSSG